MKQRRQFIEGYGEDGSPSDAKNNLKKLIDEAVAECKNNCPTDKNICPKKTECDKDDTECKQESTECVKNVKLCKDACTIPGTKKGKSKSF